MQKKKFVRTQLPIALGSGLVLLFAGCQVATPTTSSQGPETTAHANIPAGTVNNNTNAATNTSTGTATNTQTGTATTNNGTTTTAVQPDAKVTGTVLDANGNPMAGVTVNAVNGFKAVTDANGKYTIDVKAQDNLRLDFSKDGAILNRQAMVSVAPGATATATTTVKTLDPTITHVSATAGGTVTNSDGSAQLIIPPNSLATDGDVRLTWEDPMPSAQFPQAYGQLPGPLVTRTLSDGSASDGDVYMPPVAFTEVQMAQTKLAPGAQATLRMKINPSALDLSKDTINFDNPSSLQQPCYEFDRSLGMWVDPATSTIQKDPDGTAWFVYTLHGADAPKNYFGLLQVITNGDYITGHQTITWQETTYVPVVVNVGGSTTIVMKPVTVTKSKIVDLYGKIFSGDVKEQSANSSLNGKPLAGATVSHEQDFFGGTTKVTDAGGNFSIPMWNQTSSCTVYGSKYYNAASSGGGFNMTINTDSSLKLTLGGQWTAKQYGETVTVDYTLDGVSKEEKVTAAPDHTFTFGRDASDDMNNFELVSVKTDDFSWVPTPDEKTASKINLRPGDHPSFTAKMYLNEAK